MARIQILELPAGDNDDRAPFAVVIDQATEATITALSDHEGQNPTQRLFTASLAQQLGARAVLCFEETIDIPANEVPVDPDGHPLKIRVEGDFDQFRDQVQAEIRKTNADITSALRAGIDHAKAAYEDSTPRPYAAGTKAGPQPRDKDQELRAANERIERLTAERGEARTWARHGYEIGQRHCGWTDHGVAPAWLTERWPTRLDSCEHLQRATEYDEAITRIRALHKPVYFHGNTICAECSAYDAQGISTDNAPMLYTDCATIKALGTKPTETHPQVTVKLRDPGTTLSDNISYTAGTTP
jgi:hypothetical protein